MDDRVWFFTELKDVAANDNEADLVGGVMIGGALAGAASIVDSLLDDPIMPLAGEVVGAGASTTAASHRHDSKGAAPEAALAALPPTAKELVLRRWIRDRLKKVTKGWAKPADNKRSRQVPFRDSPCTRLI